VPSAPTASASAPVLDSSLAAGGRLAVAGDYAWFRGVRDLSKGFCFVWVSQVTTGQVLKRMGAKELERIGWQQLVGAGDGERVSSGKRYFGVSRLDDSWSLIVEDNGTLGTADELLRKLSAETSLICLYRAAEGSGRFLLLRDQDVQLEFDPWADAKATGTRATELAPAIAAVGGSGAEAGFALAERVTGVPLDLAGLEKRTYLFSTVATGQ
jgi:hypothetical protein